MKIEGKYEIWKVEAGVVKQIKIGEEIIDITPKEEKVNCYICGKPVEIATARSGDGEKPCHAECLVMFKANMIKEREKREREKKVIEDPEIAKAKKEIADVMRADTPNKGKRIAKVENCPIFENVLSEFNKAVDYEDAVNKIWKFHPDIKKKSAQRYFYAYRDYSSTEIEHLKHPQERKRRKKKKSAIKGHKIPGKLARDIEQKYQTRLTKERYLLVLKFVSVNTKPTEKIIVDTIGTEDFTRNNIYAHLRYGVENKDIQFIKGKYTLRRNGQAYLDKLSKKVPKNFKPCTKCGVVKPLEAFAINNANKDGRQTWCRDCHNKYTSHRERQKRKKNSKAGDKPHGTPFDDEVSHQIHEKYGIWPKEEPYLKIVNALDNAWNHRLTNEEIKMNTSLSQSAIDIHLRYAMGRNKIQKDGDKYILTSHVKRLSDFDEPKEEKVVKVKSRSWLRNLNKD